MDKLLLQCLQEQAREYLSGGTDEERGGLVSKDLKFYPFENVSDNPRCEIRMGKEGFMQMMQLQNENNLLAWVHTHSRAPFPSLLDIVEHNTDISMIIYSVRQDKFVEYTSSTVRTAARGVQNGGG